MAFLGTAPVCKLVAMIFICMVTVVPSGSGAPIPCGTVANQLEPCFPYIENGGRPPIPGSSCCQGVKYLVDVGRDSKPTRQNICNCLNEINSIFNQNQINNAAKLPGSCRENIPFAIKRNIDCNSVN